ncbi:MAG: hypothetical protein NZ951_00180 [Dehalococcoidia bacterium]|nr:hypothetical protein [Dehalococcoidia bacterium]MDW8119062.1 hypothetical protein [Chloroflexota bacterium]
MKASLIPFRLEHLPDGQWEAFCPLLGCSVREPTPSKALARLRHTITAHIPHLAQDDAGEDLIPWWRA